MRHAAVVFALQLVLGLAAALLLAVVWALAHGGHFVHSLQLGLFVVGALALLFGALGVGGMSPSQGLVLTAGRIPGMRTITRVSPGTTTVNATAIFFLTGIALIALGAFV